MHDQQGADTSIVPVLVLHDGSNGSADIGVISLPHRRCAACRGHNVLNIARRGDGSAAAARADEGGPNFALDSDLASRESALFTEGDRLARIEQMRATTTRTASNAKEDRRSRRGGRPSGPICTGGKPSFGSTCTST